MSILKPKVMSNPSLIFTTQEQEALNAICTAWEKIVLLPIEHDDDIDEARVLIHNLQARIMSRPIRRMVNGTSVGMVTTSNLTPPEFPKDRIG
jgi:hypothetical protein